jgi:hypothetical protein
MKTAREGAMRRRVLIAAVAATMVVGVGQVEAESCAAVLQECLSQAAQYGGYGKTCRRAFRNSQGGFFQTDRRTHAGLAI